MKVLTYKDKADKLERQPYVVALVYDGGTKIERFRFEDDRDRRARELSGEHGLTCPSCGSIGEPLAEPHPIVTAELECPDCHAMFNRKPRREEATA
jgi:hypothetical protein